MNEVKLTQEDKAALQEMLEHPGWRPFEKLLNAYLLDLEHELLRIDLKPGRESELAYAKARTEGGKKLCNNLIKHLTKLRSKSEE